jgi:hypothetical protein
MKANEIWIGKYNPNDGVLLEEIQGKSWKCKFLRLVRPGEYAIAKGRVSSRIDPGACYTGEGIISEDSLNRFYTSRTGISIVEAPDAFVTISEAPPADPLGV